MGVAILMNGGPACMYGPRAYQAFQDFTAAKETTAAKEFTAAQDVKRRGAEHDRRSLAHRASAVSTTRAASRRLSPR